MREIRTSGLMSGEGKRTAPRSTAPLLDSTNSPAESQSDPSSRAVRLCREERVEYTFAQLRRNSWSVVSNAQGQHFLLDVSRDKNARWRAVWPVTQRCYRIAED